MSKWEMVRLGDICDVRDGTHDSPKYVESGYPLVTSKNVSNGYIDISDVNYISKEDYDKINVRSGVDNGDIIMPMIGTIGNPVIVQKKFEFAIKNVALIKFLDTKVVNQYIFYILSSNIFKRYIEKENRGGTQKFISLGNIRNLQLPLPPLEVQKKIAQTLDAASELIVLRKKQLAELDNLIKATFYDMFGDPVVNERGWGLKTLQEMIGDGGIVGHLDGNHGGLYPRAEEFVEAGVPYIGANTIINGKIDFKKAKYLSYERALQFRKGIAKEGDVLFAHNATVGPVAILHTKEDFVILSTSLTYYRCNKQKINNYYLMAYMKTPFFVAQYQKCMGQTTRNQVPITMQKTFLHMLPPIDLQNQFAEVISKIEEQKALVQKAIDKSQCLFNSLMSEYFE